MHFAVFWLVFSSFFVACMTDDTHVDTDTSSICFKGQAADTISRLLINEGEIKDFGCKVVEPKGCEEIDGKTCDSGVYTIYPTGYGPVDVYCKLTKQGPGWTVFQRRFDGKIDFYRDWNDYKNGFGNLEGEFWLGNDTLSLLTSKNSYELRVDLEDFEGESRYAFYKIFSVSGADKKYKLTVGGYSGNAGDSLEFQNGCKFSTRDQDNDPHNTTHCAIAFAGAWWYKNCHKSNLNGAYLKGATKVFAKGVVWYAFRGHLYSLKSTTMMMRKT